jgi:Lsr2
MAQRTVVVMTDDLTGGDATQTVHFSLDNADYVIDLNDKNAAGLRADFDKYIEAARPYKAAGSVVRGRGKGRVAEPDTAAVREWARANGFEVSDRGRVSGKIRDAFLAAS